MPLTIFRSILRPGLLCFAFLFAVRAGELAPELGTASLTHRSSSAVLRDQRVATLELLDKPYLAALDAADKTATATGNVATVRAIAKEREAVTKGEMTESISPDLPKSLSPARKAYMRGFERAHADYAQKQKVLDTNYLRTLAALQAKGAGNAALDAQIKAEKERVLAGVYGPLTDLRVGLEGTQWKDVKDGKLHAFQDGKLDNTWMFEPVAADKVKLHWNATSKGTFTLSKDGKKLSDAERVWELIIPSPKK